MKTTDYTEYLTFPILHVQTLLCKGIVLRQLDQHYDSISILRYAALHCAGLLAAVSSEAQAISQPTPNLRDAAYSVMQLTQIHQDIEDGISDWRRKQVSQTRNKNYSTGLEVSNQKLAALQGRVERFLCLALVNIARSLEEKKHLYFSLIVGRVAWMNATEHEKIPDGEFKYYVQEYYGQLHKKYYTFLEQEDELVCVIYGPKSPGTKAGHAIRSYAYQISLAAKTASKRIGHIQLSIPKLKVKHYDPHMEVWNNESRGFFTLEKLDVIRRPLYVVNSQDTSAIEEDRVSLRSISQNQQPIVKKPLKAPSFEMVDHKIDRRSQSVENTSAFAPDTQKLMNKSDLRSALKSQQNLDRSFRLKDLKPVPGSETSQLIQKNVVFNLGSESQIPPTFGAKGNGNSNSFRSIPQSNPQKQVPITITPFYQNRPRLQMRLESSNSVVSQSHSADQFKSPTEGFENLELMCSPVKPETHLEHYRKIAHSWRNPNKSDADLDQFNTEPDTHVSQNTIKVGSQRSSPILVANHSSLSRKTSLHFQVQAQAPEPGSLVLQPTKQSHLLSAQGSLVPQQLSKTQNQPYLVRLLQDSSMPTLTEPTVQSTVLGGSNQNLAPVQQSMNPSPPEGTVFDFSSPHLEAPDRYIQNKSYHLWMTQSMLRSTVQPAPPVHSRDVTARFHSLYHNIDRQNQKVAFIRRSVRQRELISSLGDTQAVERDLSEFPKSRKHLLLKEAILRQEWNIQDTQKVKVHMQEIKDHSIFAQVTRGASPEPNEEKPRLNSRRKKIRMYLQPTLSSTKKSGINLISGEIEKVPDSPAKEIKLFPKHNQPAGLQTKALKQLQALMFKHREVGLVLL